MSIDLRAYWPNPAAGTQLLVQGAYGPLNNQSKTILRRYIKRGTFGGSPVVRMDEYNGDGSHDYWELQDIGGVMTEVGDARGANHYVYKPGKGIPWGGTMEVGQSYGHSIEVDPALSTGYSPGYWNFGYQNVTMQELLPTFTNPAGLEFTDVVKLHIMQSWCANNGCAWPDGQKAGYGDYWLAPGVGFVQIDYNADPASRHYARSITETWETP